MRLSSFLIPVCAVLAALASRPAAALSCIGPPWSQGTNSYGREGTFPTDVVLWETRSCAFGVDRPSGCTLTASGVTIPVDIELVGAEACGSEDDFDTDAYHVVHYIPSQTLAPDTTYTFECERNGPFEGEIEILASVEIGSATASAPGSLADAEVQGVRSDDGCCGYGDFIELRLDTEAAFLREGGYVEVRYADGKVLALGPQDEPGVIKMPDTREPLDLTPVAADGTRGETRRFEEVPRELVYIPCTVTERPPPLALWMVAPLLWIGAHGRRRRRAGGAS